jgi:hypothetical protein
VYKLYKNIYVADVLGKISSCTLREENIMFENMALRGIIWT